MITCEQHWRLNITPAAAGQAGDATHGEALRHYE
jgi:hypothetical protein